MNRDPFFRQIVERLQGSLDPELFEQGAADLLRAAHPTLVPVRGGVDAGMDGAIADGQGEPFPLIATTGQDVIGNLTRNLNSYLNRGGNRRKVVLATSQYLSARRRENLSRRASELGFTLISIHDQDAIAHLLYRSPEWCLELLNLAGDPSPLSVVPRTTRPQLTGSLIGRDRDREWLRGTGDRLLVGQPGIGKTSLLQTLVDEGRALYVISHDRGEIAAALRRQEGELALIVDDAHLYSAVIPELLQLRTETRAEFSLIASCWPGFEDALAGQLALSEQQIHRLELLSRDDIVAVVKSVGLRGPNGLIKEIVDQAQGRPGLAVTLAFLCLQGGVPDLLSGAAIYRTLLARVVEDLSLTPRVRLVLASLAAGGDAGMALNDVSTFLSVSPMDIWDIVTLLEQSGIVFALSKRRISVQPPALRHTLVRDVFFGSAASPPIEGLLTKAPNPAEVAMTLLGAKARGAAIPEDLLIDGLRRSDSDTVWREYAWMGRGEAKWVITNLPERIVSLARPLLMHIPDIVIPALLERAIGDDRPLHAHPDHPLRLLSDWIKQAHPQTGQACPRRQMLVVAVRNWLLDHENDTNVGLRALEWAIFPGFEVSWDDPGAGNTTTVQFGLLPTDDLLSVAGFWEQVLSILRAVQIEEWEPIRHAVENWVYPGRAVLGRITVPGDVSEQMRERAGRMLEDILPLASHRPGVLQWMVATADALDLGLEIPVDEDYQIIYPLEELGEDWRVVGERQGAAVRELATIWSRGEPEEIVKRIIFLETESRQSGSRYPRWDLYLCRQIAQQIQLATPWLQAWMQVLGNHDFVMPFLERAVVSEEPNWEKYALQCFERPNYRLASIQLALTMEAPPEELFEVVLSQLAPYSRAVEAWCSQNSVPEDTLVRLLAHESPAVSTAAAEGEWQADPQGMVRASLYEAWRDVVVNCATEAYWLEEVLRQDSRLAYVWLGTQLSRAGFILYRQVRSVRAAISSLGTDARQQIMALVSPGLFQAGELLAYLVGDDLEVFNTLLASERLADFHLLPLSEYPDQAWVDKAQLALDAGYPVEEIAAVLVGMLQEYSGNESDMWGDWLERLAPLASHEDKRLCAIGDIARARVEERRRKALEEERREAVFRRW